MHPRNLMTGSCGYYEQLAKMISVEIELIFKRHIPKEFTDSFYQRLGLTVAGYLEDLASGFGIWNTFRSICRERYGTFPFYHGDFSNKTEEYSDSDINYDDVRFIVWMELNVCGEELKTVYSPISSLVEKMTDLIYDNLVAEWETAPESTRIADFIDKSLRSDDWLTVRELAIWLAEGCYLTRIYNFREAILASSLSGKGNEMMTTDFHAYVSTVIYSLTKELRPLGMTSLKFMSAMASTKGFSAAAHRLDQARVIGISDYDVISYEGNLSRIRCVRRRFESSPWVGEELTMDVNSMKSKKGFEVGAEITTSLVKWGETCCVNGFCVISEKHDKTDAERDEESTPQYTEKDVETLRKYSAELIARNGGSRFAFLKDKADLEKFMGVSHNGKSDMADEEMVLYINDIGGGEISHDAVPILKSPENTFYDKELAKEDGLSVICGNMQFGYDAIIAAIKGGMLTDASMLASQGEDIGRQLVQENIYFLADFYHSVLTMDV